MHTCMDLAIDSGYLSIIYPPHRITSFEISLNATADRQSAPGTEFNLTGLVTFDAAPSNAAVSPSITCEVETGATVSVDSVQLMWLVDSIMLNPTSTAAGFLTIRQQLRLSLMACLPVSTTSVALLVLLPTDPDNTSIPLVSVRNAAVAFVGQAVQNTTLLAGDGEKLLCRSQLRTFGLK